MWATTEFDSYTNFFRLGTYHVQTNTLVQTMQTAIITITSRSNGSRERWAHFTKNRPTAPAHFVEHPLSRATTELFIPSVPIPSSRSCRRQRRLDCFAAPRRSEGRCRLPLRRSLAPRRNPSPSPPLQRSPVLAPPRTPPVLPAFLKECENKDGATRVSSCL
jgi:hypothetical protein